MNIEAAPSARVQRSELDFARNKERIQRKVAAKVQADPAAALVEAKAVYQSAREHKRLASHHRNRARYASVEFEAFKAQLEVMGIVVVVEAH